MWYRAEYGCVPPASRGPPVTAVEVAPVGAFALLWRGREAFAAWWQRGRSARVARMQLREVGDAFAHAQFSAHQHALLASLVDARSRVTFTEAEMADYAARIRDGVREAQILLRLDATIASIAQLDDHARQERAGFIESRTSDARQLRELREDMLAVAPEMRSYWTDELDSCVRDIIRQSENVMDQIASGIFPRRDVLDVAVDMVRFLPVSFGEIRELPDEIVSYAAQAHLSYLLVMRVAPMLKTAFVAPGNLKVAVVEDADVDEDWLDIEVEVDDAPGSEDPAQRFLSFIRVLDPRWTPQNRPMVDG